jgi:NitT/TauT family transport system substrate-binding protein
MESLHCVHRGLATLALIAASASAVWAQAGGKLTPLNIATLPIAAQTDVWVAQQRGMFAKNGIDAKITQFGIAGPAINAMQGGSIDVLLVIVGLGMTAMQQNFDLVPVFQDEVGHPTAPDSATLQVLASSPISKLSDLAGKKIGLGGLNTQNAILTKYLLQKAGVDLKTVQFVETTFPSMPTNLKMGQVDAVAAIDPFSTQLYSTGTGKVLAWNYVDTIPQQPIGVWFAKGSVAKNKPQLIEAFVRSMKEAVDYLKADEKQARQEIVAYTRLDADLIDKMPLINWDYQVRPDKWQAVIDLMAEYGQMRPQKASEFLTSPHIEQFIFR